MSKLLAQAWALPAFSILAAAVFLAVHFSSNNWREDPNLERGGDYDLNSPGQNEEEPPELTNGGYLTDEWIRPFTYVPTSTPNEDEYFVPIPTMIVQEHSIPPPVGEGGGLWQWNPTVYGNGPTPDPALLQDPATPPSLKEATQWGWNVEYGEPTPDPAKLTDPATPPSLKTNQGSPVHLQWALAGPTPDPALLTNPATPPALVTTAGSPVQVKWDIPAGQATPDPATMPAAPPNLLTTQGSPVVIKWNIPGDMPTPDPAELLDPATPPYMVLNPGESPVKITWNTEFFPEGQPTPDPATLLAPNTPPEWKQGASSPVNIGWTIPKPSEPTQPTRPLEVQKTSPPTEPTRPLEVKGPTFPAPTTASPVTLSPTRPGETRAPVAPFGLVFPVPTTESPTRPGETRAPVAPFELVFPVPTTESPTTESPTRPGETRAPVTPFELVFPVPTTDSPTRPGETRAPVAPFGLAPTTPAPTRRGETNAPVAPVSFWTAAPRPLETTPPTDPPQATPSPTLPPSPSAPINLGFPVSKPVDAPPPPPPKKNPPPTEPKTPPPVEVNPPPFNPPPPPPVEVPQPVNPPPFFPPPFNPPPQEFPQPFNPPPFFPPPFNPPQPVPPRPVPQIPGPGPPRPVPQIPRPGPGYFPPAPAPQWGPTFPPGHMWENGWNGIPGPGWPGWQHGPHNGVVYGGPGHVYPPPPLHNQVFLEGCDPHRCSYNEDAEFHSMSNEDEGIFELFYTNPHKCCRVVVEIGAGNGDTYSFSKFFEEALNWRSLLIEANPDHYEDLKYNRNEAVAKNGAFCENDHLEFYRGGQGTFTSLGGDIEISSELHSPRPNNGQKTPDKLVPCLKMNQVFTQHGITKVDVMVIRLQGDALAFIRSMDWTVRVDIWVVLMHGATDSDRNALVASVLERNQYHMAWWDIRRWCERNGMCLNNQVFLREGVNPLPCDDLYNHRVGGGNTQYMARRLEGGGEGGDGTPKGLPGHLRLRRN